MGMPLDIDLACSNHASYNCGLLAFGLPSASNKLSQPDPSDVQLSTQMHRESEGVGTQTLSDLREGMEIYKYLDNHEFNSPDQINTHLGSVS